MNVHRRDLASLKEDLHNHYNVGAKIRSAGRRDAPGKDAQIKDRYVKMFPHAMEFDCSRQFTWRFHRIRGTRRTGSEYQRVSSITVTMTQYDDRLFQKITRDIQRCMRSSTWPYCAKRSAKPVSTLYYHLQVAEFELSASTLRTNSSAMTLGKNLVTKSMSDVFTVLQDFRPRPRPDIPEQVEKRMEKWARRKEGEWEVEGTWETVERRSGRESWGALRKQEVERERERMQRLAETRVRAWEQAQAQEKVVRWGAYTVPIRTVRQSRSQEPLPKRIYDACHGHKWRCRKQNSL